MASGFFEGKVVCVTGAGGSIGTELCVQLLAQGVGELRLVSLTENGLYNLMRRLKPIAGTTKLTGVLGNVADPKLMEEVLAGADVVVHAAAHKHVTLCEENPLAAIANNVGGTCSLASAAVRAKVGTFVLISTDKAVKPTSVMGATKRVCELALRDVFSAGSKLTSFVTVRFGNVLYSAGSVLNLWAEQAGKGEPITLTDPNCERYFMSIPDAVELVLSAAPMSNGLYVFDMGEPRKMCDLARDVLRQRGMGPEDIVVTGLRPGEKLVEELHHGGMLIQTGREKIFEVEDETERTLEFKQLQALSEHTRQRNVKAALHYLWGIVK